MHERRFVMVPVCDVAPDLIHPRLGRTMSDLLADLAVDLFFAPVASFSRQPVILRILHQRRNLAAVTYLDELEG
jgi:hypothetical protein